MQPGSGKLLSTQSSRHRRPSSTLPSRPPGGFFIGLLQMRMSDHGRKLLTVREGLRLKAYRDSVGIWTIGIGHTAAAGKPFPAPGMTITAQECDQILIRDLARFEREIGNAVKVPLAQHEFDALVSICFNVGPRFAQSTCIRRLNAGDRRGAAEAIMLWRKPPEIIGRRRAEQAQFRTPYVGAAARPAADPAPAAKPVAPPPSPERPTSMWDRIAFWR